MSGFYDTSEVDVLEHEGQQGVTAPHAAWELGAALADHSVPVDGRDGVAVSQFLRMAADAWAAAKTEECTDRALERVRFLRLLERGPAWRCTMPWRTPGGAGPRGPGPGGH
ncbi:hypothetical protein GCM10009696_34810 [Kocuria himachalensis]